MARFYFHVIDGQRHVDDEGTECREFSDVREQAIATAGAILIEAARELRSDPEWQMHVTDDKNVTVLRLRFSVEELLAQAPPAPAWPSHNEV